MKKPLFSISTALLAVAAQGQIVLVNENFDSYSAATFLAQSAGAPWTTWSNSPGGIDDVLLSSDHAASGSNSGLWVSSSASGGPGDVVVNLGNQTSGTWNITFNMYIPSNYGGYFNVLHLFQGSNSQWAVEVSFLINGNVSLMLQGTSTVYGTYPHDTWFPVHVNVDLNSVSASLQVDNTVVFNWPFNWNAGDATVGLNQLGGVDFYAYAGGNDGGKYYIDDVVVQSLTTGIEEASAGTVHLYPNPVEEVLYISNTPGTGTWVLRDAAGREVKEGPVPGGASSWNLDMAGLPPGVYQFELLQNGHHTVRKVMKG